MLKGMKRKIIMLATLAMLLLMLLLVGMMNVINFTSVVAETDRIIEMLSRPDIPFEDGRIPTDMPPKKIEGFLPHGMSPEVPFESRFFSVIVSEDGEIQETNIRQIISVDDSTVNAYVQKALRSKQEKGFIEQFRYHKIADGDKIKIIFLDSGRKLDSFFQFMEISFLVGLSGCMIVFLIFLLGADRIMRPIIESNEKQKQFITDAGHEIKTPLTIISANMDLLEVDYGENESLSDVRTQITRIRDLTNSLVYLSKMEETDKQLTQIDFSLSDIAEDMAQPFSALAQTQNKIYTIAIEPNVTMYGAQDAIRQLISILLENAMKYSPEGGAVAFALKRHKKYVSISVSNTTIEEMQQEQLSRLFDRFYRSDASRNSETGGYGLGLSIAKAIVNNHKGKISAETQNGHDFKITARLPL